MIKYNHNRLEGLILVYFGENNEYILCECETCRGEMYIERNAVSEEDAYSYHLLTPVKCRCGAIDEYINRAKKSCHAIKHELSAMSDILHRQQNVSNKISEITAELNKRFDPPSFWQSAGRDLLYSLKILLILAGAVIGLELLLFIISSLMFFFGKTLTKPDLAGAGNEFFYHINIFKDWGGSLLSKFGMPETYNRLNTGIIREQLILDYIPYAVTGALILAFYAFLAVLFVRIGIDVAKITFFAGRVVNQKIKINQKKEDYRRQLDELGVIYKKLTFQLSDFTILPEDYKNIRAADSILKSFIDNRADNIRDAVNLYHEDDFKSKMLEYCKGAYNEARQTRRYTKALYMLTSDDKIKVEVKDVREELSESDNQKVGEMLKNAFSKIQKPSDQKKLPQPSGPLRIKPEENDKSEEDNKNDKSNKNEEENKNTEETAGGKSGEKDEIQAIFGENTNED